MSRIVIALGGNALGNTAEEQRVCIDAAAPSLVGLIAVGHEIITSHGTGAQVGTIGLPSRSRPSTPTGWPVWTCPSARP